jgi:hypothetical protein
MTTPFKSLIHQEMIRLEQLVHENDSFSGSLAHYARKNGILLGRRSPTWGWLSMVRVMQFLL